MPVTMVAPMLAHGVALHFWSAHQRLAQLLRQQHADAERQDEQPHYCVRRCGAEQRVAPRRVRIEFSNVMAVRVHDTQSGNISPEMPGI